jgi:hypothetical protein
VGVASVTRLPRRSHLDCGDSCPSNSPRPVCQRSLCLFLLHAWLMMPLRDSQLPDTDENQKATTGMALVLMAELPLVNDLIIMRALRAVKQRQANAHMFIYQSNK